MSTKARWLIRDGDGGGRGGEKEWVAWPHTPTLLRPGKTKEAMDHSQDNYVKAVGILRTTTSVTCYWSRVTRTRTVAQLLMNNWNKRSPNFQSPAPPPCSWPLLGSLDGSAEPSSTSLLLISPGPTNESLTSSWESNFFMRVQLTSLLMISDGLGELSILLDPGVWLHHIARFTLTNCRCFSEDWKSLCRFIF